MLLANRHRPVPRNSTFEKNVFCIFVGFIQISFVHLSNNISTYANTNIEGGEMNMRKTFITLLIICMLAVLLTGCTGVNDNDNVVPDVIPTPNMSPYVSPGYGGNNNGNDLGNPDILPASPVPNLTQ